VCVVVVRYLNATNIQGTAIASGSSISVDIDTASLILANKLRSDCGDIRTWLMDSITERLIDEVAFVITPTTCNTAVTHITIALPEIDRGESIVIVILYGDASARTTTSSPSVLSYYDTFTITNPRQWVYSAAIGQPVASFASDGAHFTADPTGTVATRHVAHFTTDMVFELMGQRWSGSTSTPASSAIMQPFIAISTSKVITFGDPSSTTLTFLSPLTPLCGGNAQKHFTMSLTVDDSYITFESDYDGCGSLAYSPIITPQGFIDNGFYVSIGSLPQVSPLSGGTGTTLMQWFSARPKLSSNSIMTDFSNEFARSFYFTCTLPTYQTIGRQLVELSLNGVDWPSDQTNSSTARYVVVHEPVDIASMDPLVSNLDASIPIQVTAANWNLSSIADLKVRLSSIDTFLPMVSTSSIDTYTSSAIFWSDGLIPNAADLTSAVGTTKVQLTFNDGQQVMNSTIRFTKNANVSCIASADAEPNLVLESIQSIASNVPLTSDMVVATQRWSPTSGGGVSTLCGAPTAIRSTDTHSFVFNGAASTDRVMETTIGVETSFGAYLTYWLHYGIGTNTLSTCRGVSSGTAASTPILIQWTNTNGAEWHTIDTIVSSGSASPTTTYSWEQRQVTLPSAARASATAGITRLRFIQFGVSTTDTRGIWAIQLIQLIGYVPVVPNVHVLSFEPKSSISSGGSVITVIGSGFDTSGWTPSCSFGGVEARHVLLVNSTMILCVPGPVVLSSTLQAMNSTFVVRAATIRISQRFAFYQYSSVLEPTLEIYPDTYFDGINPYLTIFGNSFFDSEEALVKLSWSTASTKLQSAQGVLVDDIYWRFPIADPLIRLDWPMSSGATAMKAHWPITQTEMTAMGIKSDDVLTGLDLWIELKGTSDIQEFTIGLRSGELAKDINSDSLTTVYGPVTLSPASFQYGWNRFNFTTTDGYKIDTTFPLTIQIRFDSAHIFGLSFVVP
jgi:hypothetical protein